MTNTEKSRESVMTRINRLLALAQDEGATQAERELAEERAERLMAAHMIEEWEARQHEDKNAPSARKPVCQDWEIFLSGAANEKVQDNYEFDHQVITMMQYVLQHCNIRVATSWKYGEGYKSRIYQVVGFKDDINYAERIWFNVFKTFVMNVNPQWDVNKSIEYNAYNFASAGVSWKDQVLLAEKAGDTRLEWPWRYQNHDPHSNFYTYTTYAWQVGEYIDPGNKPWGRSIHKLKRACKKYCDDNQLQYPYARGEKLRIATRNSFARSYRSTITERLRVIRSEATNSMDSEVHSVNADKFALAIKDTKERVDEEFYRLFPEYDPEVRARKRKEEEFLRACAWAALTPQEQQEVLKQEATEEAKWQARARRTRRNYGTVREDPTSRYDAAAWSRGKAAAETVSLRADAEVKHEGKTPIKNTPKEIN